LKTDTSAKGVSIMFNIAKVVQTPLQWPQWIADAVARYAPRAQQQQSQPVVALPAADVPAPTTIDVLLMHGSPAMVQLQVTGELNRHNYEALIEIAADWYRQGRRDLLLDLRETPRVDLSGFFALLSIAHLYSGEPLPDPAEGWRSLRRAAEKATPEMGQRVKLLATPALAEVIRKVEFCDFLEIYSTPDPATAAFSA
jgi:hypothetical protein